MTRLWSIVDGRLRPVPPQRLASEEQIETWLETDINMLGQDLLVIGRQVVTSHGGRIDLLAISSDGSISMIELKRDRTPRDIVAQVLDYGSWVHGLDTPAVHALADQYWRARGSSFTRAYFDRFGMAPPEPLNTSHRLVIVASALDPASQRIVEYLSNVHGVGINTAFFTVFGEGDQRFLSADWLMDQAEVLERTERKVRAPWSGYWYVNAGDGDSRTWADMRAHGFISAGGGRVYSGRLDQLAVGSPIYVYQKGVGYVGFGIVTSTARMARDTVIDDTGLLDLPLQNPNLGHDRDDSDLAEYAVPVRWIATVPLEDAKTFPGAFANQNVVCKLRDTTTLDFLAQTLGTREDIDQSV